MSMRGSRAGHMWVNLRDMRIARMDRKISVKPCADEVTLSQQVSPLWTNVFLLTVVVSLILATLVC